jgi:type IV pilus assembly protein PilB
MAPRVRLGELLVEAQIVTREQLEEVLALQKRDARRLGTLLIE